MLPVKESRASKAETLQADRYFFNISTVAQKSRSLFLRFNWLGVSLNTSAPRARRSVSRSSSGKVKNKIGPDRTPYPVLMWFALLGRSFLYLQQEPFRLTYAEGGLITLESGKLDFQLPFYLFQ